MFAFCYGFCRPFAGVHFASAPLYPPLTTANAFPFYPQPSFQPHPIQNRRLDQEVYPSQPLPAFQRPKQTDLYPSHRNYGNSPLSFEPEAEFVPLEAQQRKTSQQEFGNQQPAATTLTKLHSPALGVPEGRDGPLKPFGMCSIVFHSLNGNCFIRIIILLLLFYLCLTTRFD